MEHGCLGNTLRNWRHYVEAYDSGVPIFGLREIGVAGGGSHIVIPRNELITTAADWVCFGRRFIVDEAAPDTDVVLQGEICRTFRGWEGLLGLRTGHRMRESARLGLFHHYSGVTVKVLLDEFLDPSSRDDIDALLDLYPEATIELASYPYTLGKIPGRNTVIWEVRCY